MPARAAANQNAMCARGRLGADVLQMLAHRLGIDRQHDDGRTDAARATDRAEQGRRVVSDIAHLGLPGISCVESQ